MEPDFWLERWSEGRIGFHLPRVNPHLERHHDVLSPRCRVLVPLAGKTLDLWWLREQGHEVTAVELSPLACGDLFREAGVRPQVTEEGPFRAWRVPGLTVLQGDVRDLPAHPRFDAVWDRAATIALPPPLRERAAHAVAAALTPGAVTLLVTIERHSGGPEGPPFSVPEAEVRRVFQPLHTIERLAGPTPAIGMTDIAVEHVWRLTRGG
jgi:thiopurine S-methyltransferase